MLKGIILFLLLCWLYSNLLLFTRLHAVHGRTAWNTAPQCLPSKLHWAGQDRGSAVGNTCNSRQTEVFRGFRHWERKVIMYVFSIESQFVYYTTDVCYLFHFFLLISWKLITWGEIVDDGLPQISVLILLCAARFIKLHLFKQVWTQFNWISKKKSDQVFLHLLFILHLTKLSD